MQALSPSMQSDLHTVSQELIFATDILGNSEICFFSTIIISKMELTITAPKPLKILDLKARKKFILIN